jgi:hypothetical protein
MRWSTSSGVRATRRNHRSRAAGPRPCPGSHSRPCRGPRSKRWCNNIADVECPLEDWRERIRDIVEHDPFATGVGKLSKKRLHRIFATGASLSLGVLHTAIEEFGVELAEVPLRFLELDEWRGTERIVVETCTPTSSQSSL